MSTTFPLNFSNTTSGTKQTGAVPGFPGGPDLFPFWLVSSLTLASSPKAFLLFNLQTGSSAKKQAPFSTSGSAHGRKISKNGRNNPFPSTQLEGCGSTYDSAAGLDFN
jgi:hypothetical protein